MVFFLIFKYGMVSVEHLMDSREKGNFLYSALKKVRVRWQKIERKVEICGRSLQE